MVNDAFYFGDKFDPEEYKIEKAIRWSILDEINIAKESKPTRYCEENKEKLRDLDEYEKARTEIRMDAGLTYLMNEDCGMAVKEYTVPKPEIAVKEVKRVPRKWFAPFYYMYLALKEVDYKEVAKNIKSNIRRVYDGIRNKLQNLWHV